MMMRLLAVFFLLSLQITSADTHATELANNSTDFPDVGNFTSSPDDAVVNGSLSAAPAVSNFTTDLPVNETTLPVNETSLPINETSLPINETSLPVNITALPAVTNFTQPSAQVNGSVPAVNVTSEQFNQTTTTLGNGTRITVAPAGNVSSPFWNNTTSRRPLNVTAAPLASNRTINATATIGNGTDPGVLFPSPAPGNTTGEEKRGADSHSATGEEDDDKQSSGTNQIVIIAVCSVLGVLVAVGVGFVVFWVIVKKKKSGGDAAKTPLLSEGQTPGSNKTTGSSSSAERV